jgi:hypothetical protein
MSSLQPAKYIVGKLQDQKRDPDEEQWPIVDTALRHWAAFRTSEWHKLRPVLCGFAKGEFQGHREIFWDRSTTRVAGGHKQTIMALRLLFDEIARSQPSAASPDPVTQLLHSIAIQASELALPVR